MREGRSLRYRWKLSVSTLSPSLAKPLSFQFVFHAVRDLAQETPPDDKRIKQIISQLWDYAAPRSQEGPNNMHTRSGGMIGLAGVTCG